ncbi:MrcB family domain-containing protein [Rhizobium brockwellii]
MIEIISRIVELQDAWTAVNSSEMIERGELIRDDLPTKLRLYAPQLAAAIGIATVDLGITGRDGSGRKTAIPWVRIFSRERSPDPRNGWYLVLLFHSEGRKLYLCLSHGSTDWTGGEFKAKPATEVEPLMKWAAQLLKPFFEADTSLQAKISLGKRGKLGGPYEASTPIAKQYDISRLPSEAEFVNDLMSFAAMLRLIYEQDDLGRIPEPETLVFQKAQEGIKEVSEGRKTRGGQGFGLTTSERRVVEDHAMNCAEAYLKARGYDCKITAAHSPFDMIASKHGEEFIVEVKGTTSPGSHIILTANEVDAHQKKHPDNALLVVHSVDLKGEASGVTPEAKGGIVVLRKPWDINKCEMRPLAYQVKI